MKIFLDEKFGDLYFEFDEGLFLLVPDKSLDPDSLAEAVKNAKEMKK
jgi:hypothetical protein